MYTPPASVVHIYAQSKTTGQIFIQFLHVRAQAVSHMGNMRIGPWAIFPLHVDGTFDSVFFWKLGVEDVDLPKN